MRLTHVIFRARFSGAEILVRDLALTQRAAGIETSIIGVEPSEESFGPEIDRLHLAGVPLFAPGCSLGSGILRSAFLYRQLGSLRPDFVVAHSILPSFYARAVRASGLRCRVATVLHSMCDFDHPTLRRTEKLIHRIHDCVVGVSQAACNGYRRTIPGFTKPIVHIPNGIDLSRFVFDSTTRQIVRTQVLNATPEERVIIQIGRIYEEKHPILTCDAVARLCSRHPSNLPIHVVFAGITEPGAYSDVFLRRVRETGNAFRITYLGGRSDIGRLLAGADLAVMPSSREAHPIAALEAAASGIPLVVSDIAAFQPLTMMPGVRSFRTNSADELADAIQKELANSPLQRFTRDVTPFSIERCAYEYLQVIAQ